MLRSRANEEPFEESYNGFAPLRAKRLVPFRVILSGNKASFLRSVYKQPRFLHCILGFVVKKFNVWH